jgi:threonine synthase
VCIITGAGVKDPDTAARQFEVDQIELPADLTAIEQALAY